MAYVLVYSLCILLYLHGFVVSCLSLSHENIIESKVLNVGEELLKETLPLQMGYRYYRLRGLKASVWYEVKISYPASIPASFSIKLKTDKLDVAFNVKRRLLNTEKLIFKAENHNLHLGHSEVHVLVTVESSGIVANPHLLERQSIIFNIVCDELSLGIPHKAWWVGILAFLCLGLALVVPYFLPPHLLSKNRSS
eukprot:TRINITY_DN672_c0_g1_i1.p1 TRINITY_DN672_c0_g1~~TRINITY_DN672_c0_g1_i1.p1  ORF type:complete len:195 (-),score=6.90 TRINITY_DN672_c0_g1_i1:64-648(-)